MESRAVKPVGCLTQVIQVFGQNRVHFVVFVSHVCSHFPWKQAALYLPVKFPTSLIRSRFLFPQVFQETRAVNGISISQDSAKFGRREQNPEFFEHFKCFLTGFWKLCIFKRKFLSIDLR